MTYIIKIPTAILRHSTVTNSQEVYLAIPIMSDNWKWRPKPEILISQAVKGAVKIPTINLRYKTMYRCKNNVGE